MWCGHKLIAGEPHLWGCQVGTELLWLQLDSIVVLIDCFLGTRAEDHFSLLPVSLVENNLHLGGFFTLFRKFFVSLRHFLLQLKEGYPQFPLKTPTHRESLSLAVG